MDGTTSYIKQLCYVLSRCNLNDTSRLLAWRIINDNRYGLFTKSLTTNEGRYMTKINMWLRYYNDAKAKGLVSYTYNRRYTW